MKNIFIKLDPEKAKVAYKMCLLRKLRQANPVFFNTTYRSYLHYPDRLTEDDISMIEGELKK